MNRRALMIGGAACVAVLLLWYFALWSPKGNELSDARDRQQSATDQAEQLALKLAQLQDAQRRAPEILAASDRLRAAVPETAELAQFLLDANDVANQSHVDYLSIAPTPPGASQNAALPSQIVVNLAVKAGYSEMLDFVDRLYAMRRIVIIDSLNVSLDSGAENPLLNLAITGRVFTTATSAAETPVAPAPSAPGAPAGDQVAAPASIGGGS